MYYLTNRATLIYCAFKKISDRSLAVQGSEINHLEGISKRNKVNNCMLYNVMRISSGYTEYGVRYAEVLLLIYEKGIIILYKHHLCWEPYKSHWS